MPTNLSGNQIGLDTHDATALSSDVRENKIFYGKNGRGIGNLYIPDLNIKVYNTTVEEFYGFYYDRNLALNVIQVSSDGSIRDARKSKVSVGDIEKGIVLPSDAKTIIGIKVENSGFVPVTIALRNDDTFMHINFNSSTLYYHHSNIGASYSMKIGTVVTIYYI